MRLRRVSLSALVLGAALAGCRTDPAPPPAAVAARVGDAVLTEEALSAALGDVPPGLDSVSARSHVVDRWVRTELLVQEARRLGLDRNPDVQRRVDESVRATLEAAALERLFAEAAPTPSPAAIARFYDAHRSELALREPYVRVRHLSVPSARAEAAAAALTEAIQSPDPDARFAAVARRYAADPDGATAFATSYVPLARFAALDPALGDRIAVASAGPAVSVVNGPAAVHVFQIVDRVPEGAVPPLAVVEAELAERLAIDARRDAEAQALERLRAEAQSRGDLALP